MNFNTCSINSIFFLGTETIEEITSFLEEYGPVDGLKLNRFTDKFKGELHKGSGFVTFKEKEAADKFLNAPMVTYKDRQLNRVSKTDYCKYEKVLGFKQN